ncbi:hypothetical protein [Brevibacillus fulvus]|uniref:Uncharacterized protein n=1 Tax=Brevibacillus fulvus TaxID=1125967 RepID=A0A939BQH7_9BACL|nr:hypothetical protein [Brevibacillus fulvus]MBM7588512.1 hypothetical protein [Brevibacillus fulvus]
MSKKQYLLSALQLFAQHADQMPPAVERKLQHAMQVIEAQTEASFADQYNMVVTQTADRQPLQEDHPLYLLQDLYSELEEVAKSHPDTKRQNELLSAVNRLRGFLEIPDRYYP